MWTIDSTSRRSTGLRAAACLLAAVLLPVAAAGAQSPAPLAPVTLILQWTPQSQFAGYYVALEKGFYAKRGLDVTILRGGPDRDQMAYLMDGRADFATRWLTAALEDIERGVPLKHIAQIINRSNLAVVGWRDRGIARLEDLDGRRVGVWHGQFRPPFIATFRAHDIEPVVVQQNYSINLFMRRGVDACSAMIYNEYHMLYQAGVDTNELVVFPLASDESPLPEDGIYCLRETYAAKPDVCAALARASVEGWEYAAAHPEEALEIVMRHVREAHVPTNRAHMRWMLRAVLESVIPSGAGSWEVGRLDRDAYERTVKMMIEQEMVRSAPAFEDFTVQEYLNVP